MFRIAFRVVLIVAFVLALAPLSADRAGAQSAPPLRTFVYGEVAKTANDWPIFIGISQGYFAAVGIQLDLVVVGGVAQLAQQLSAGSIDIGSQTTIQAVEAIAGGAPIINFITRDASSPYVLLGRKGLSAIRDLRGKTIIVGGANDNTRIYTDGILAHHGFKPADYDYVFAGNSADRFAALVSGGVDASLLAPPFSFQAQALGYPVLDEAYKYFLGLPQDTIATNVNWAKAHGPELVAFTRAYLRSLHFFYDPANRARCLQILVDTTNVKPEVAAQTYDYLQKIKFFSPTGSSTAQDWQRVFDVLNATNQMKPPYPPFSALVDSRYLTQALKTR